MPLWKKYKVILRFFNDCPNPDNTINEQPLDKGIFNKGERRLFCYERRKQFNSLGKYHNGNVQRQSIGESKIGKEPHWTPPVQPVHNALIDLVASILDGYRGQKLLMRACNIRKRYIERVIRGERWAEEYFFFLHCFDFLSMNLKNYIS